MSFNRAIWILCFQYFGICHGKFGSRQDLSREFMLEGINDKTYNGSVIANVFLDGGHDTLTQCVKLCLEYTSGPACVAVNLSELGECKLLAPLLKPANPAYIDNTGWRSMTVPNNCPYAVYIPGEYHCYHIDDQEKGIWASMLGFCQWKLLLIQTASENMFLDKTLRFYGLGNMTFWTAGYLTPAIEDHDWLVRPGLMEDMTFTSWAQGHPSVPKQACITLQGGAWYDSSCVPDRHYYICEAE